MAFFTSQKSGGRKKASRGILVSEVIKDKSKSISTVALDASVPDCAKIMTFMKVGVLVVLDENRNLAGMVPERAIAEAIGHDERDMSALTVADIMTKDVTPWTPETDLEDVLETMKEKNVRHVPVMEYNQIAGIISISDILRYCL